MRDSGICYVPRDKQTEAALETHAGSSQSPVPCFLSNPCSQGLAYLSKEGDWLLAHSLGIPYIGANDLSEWLFDTLSREKATDGYLDTLSPRIPGTKQ